MASNAAGSSLDLVTLPVNVIFEGCSIVALKSAEIYRVFAEKHAQFADLERMWHEASDEARSDSDHFKRLSILKEPGLLDPDERVCDARSVIHHLDSIFRTLQRTPVLPVPALQFAIRLEAYLSRFLSESVTVCNHPELKKLLEGMLDTSLKHVEVFKQALGKWLPGDEALAKIRDVIDDLFFHMQKLGFSQVDILKVAVQFEDRLSRYLRASDVGEYSEMGNILSALVDKNQNNLEFIKKELEKVVAKEKGTA